jgi:hypothetical protein
MNATERKQAIDALRPWVLQCAAFMHLDHWTITVEEDEPTDNAHASIRRWQGQMDAEFRFSDEYFAKPEIERRQTLAHELCHAHLRPMWETWVDLDELLGKPAYTMFRNHASIAEEQVVEALSKVLAPLLPPPPPPPTEDDWLAVATVQFGP